MAGWAPEKGQVIPEFAQSPGPTADVRNLHPPSMARRPKSYSVRNEAPDMGWEDISGTPRPLFPGHGACSCLPCPWLPII